MTFPRKMPLWTGAFLSVFLSCSHYGLNALKDEGRELAPAQFKLPHNVTVVHSRLLDHLKDQGIFERSYVEKNRIVLEQAWVRSESLRYYMSQLDERKRHPSEWKAVWTLSADPKSKHTVLDVEVLELIFCGTSSDLDRHPAPDPEGDFWYETPPDLVRAHFLVKNFWEQRLPETPPPANLRDFKLPNPFLLPPRSTLKRIDLEKMKKPGSSL